MPEVHPQLCHLLNCHFKYFSPSFYTDEKGECSYYRSLLMCAVLQETLKVSSHLLSLCDVSGTPRDAEDDIQKKENEPVLKEVII